MTHLWIRAETRANERRVGIMPEGVSELIGAGFQVTVEEDPTRIVPIDAFRSAGAAIAPTLGWETAPDDAIILGLKELPESDAPLRHRHIMFGHAFKEQTGWQAFLGRFRRGGGTLYDLEYLVDENGRRVAAFGYWAGFAGAAVSLLAFAAASSGGVAAAVSEVEAADDMVEAVREALGGRRPRALVIGAKGRVGGGAAAMCRRLGLEVTEWDIDETAHGGPFPEILTHDIFLNCILAAPGVPVFVGPDAVEQDRALRVIGDIACDPTSDYSPVPLYSAPTSWADPVVRVAENPTLDIMAIDNLPSLMPRESSEDFAAQLLPYLKALDHLDRGVWARAEATFREHLGRLNDSDI